jgi:hypothetical protein
MHSGIASNLMASMGFSRGGGLGKAGGAQGLAGCCGFTKQWYRAYRHVGRGIASELMASMGFRTGGGLGRAGVV